MMTELFKVDIRKLRKRQFCVSVSKTGTVEHGLPLLPYGIVNIRVRLFMEGLR